MNSESQKIEKRYALSSGTQVRKEDFGLLFYTMSGPRLYFLPSSDILPASYFDGKTELNSWLSNYQTSQSLSEKQIRGLAEALAQLVEKGVIHEC